MQMHRSGAKKVDIARHLYGMGVRPFWTDSYSYWVCESAMAQLVGYVIRKHSAEPKKPAKVTRIVQDWQTWTPEMQAAEFAAGYA